MVHESPIRDPTHVERAGRVGAAGGAVRADHAASGRGSRAGRRAVGSLGGRGRPSRAGSGAAGGCVGLGPRARGGADVAADLEHADRTGAPAGADHVRRGADAVLEFRLCRAIWLPLVLTQGGSVSHARSWAKRAALPACDT